MTNTAAVITWRGACCSSLGRTDFPCTIRAISLLSFCVVCGKNIMSAQLLEMSAQLLKARSLLLIGAGTVLRLQQYA